jgi:hypothetical protein
MDTIFIIYAILNFIILFILTIIIIGNIRRLSGIEENNNLIRTQYIDENNITKDYIKQKLINIRNDIENNIKPYINNNIYKIDDTFLFSIVIFNELNKIIDECITQSGEIKCTPNIIKTQYKTKIQELVNRYGISSIFSTNNNVDNFIFYTIIYFYKLIEYYNENDFLYSFALKHKFQKDIEDNYLFIKSTIENLSLQIRPIHQAV